MKYYNEEINEVLMNLNTKHNGLDELEAKRRLKKNGLNELQTEVKISSLRIFLEQFQSFIVYILLFAIFICLIFGHYLDVVIIAVILIANAIVGFFQEYSAQKSLEALKKMSLVEAKVYRNNQLVRIDSKNLVVGDVVFLEAGDKVPADCRIVEHRKLKIEESALTGESLPVSKFSHKIDKEVQISDQKNMIFSGTSLSEGTCRAIVTSTAMQTEIGKITKLIVEAKEEMTPFQIKLDNFGRKLSYVIIGICCFVFFALTLMKGFSTDNILEFALVTISLAVAAVPTALPFVVTASLSIGVKRLLKKKSLVKKLSSVETLGSCNVICSDKTGTITKNEMTVKYAWTINGETKIDGVGYNPRGTLSHKLNSLLFKIGFFCNNSSLYKDEGMWKISGDPTEAALVVSSKKAEISEKGYEKFDEIPFDSTRKMMSTLHKENNKGDVVMFSKGSTSHILERCSHILIHGKEEKLTSKLKEEVLKQNDLYSSKALRVLSFAYKSIKDIKNDKSDKDKSKDFVEDKLTFVGLQAMIDPPRPDVIDSIKKCKKAGIRIIMITGDYKETAKAIGSQVGIKGNILAGSDVEAMSDKDLEKALEDNTNIFARVIPEHKQRIISALQRQGNVVAMTGDGVNDAPALKKANIGVAVGSGTDVAKEAADFILLDDSFSNIVNAIEEGRGIYYNIQKSLMLLLSGNFGEVMIIFLAVIFGFNLPLTAILLLWINLVTDGAPATAFSVDPYSKNIMNKGPVKSSEGILPKEQMILIAVLGMLGTIIGLYLFDSFGGNVGDEVSQLAQTMIFNFIVLYEMLLVFIIRRQYEIKQFSNGWLWSSIGFTVLLQIIMMYTPMRNWFGVVALNLTQLGILAFAGGLFYLGYLVYYYLSKVVCNQY